MTFPGHGRASQLNGGTRHPWLGSGASGAINRGEITPRPRNYAARLSLVESLLNEGIGIAEIAERLGVSKPTVCYHARKLGVAPRREFARRYDWAEIQEAYESGLSMRECKRRLGFSSDAWAAAVRRGDIVPRDRLMQLHHKNGDGSDNRLENIQFPCGTCHSQTDTYGGKNGHRKPDRHLRLVEPPEIDDAAESA